MHTEIQFDQDAAIEIVRAYNAPADSKSLIGMATALKVGCKARGEGEDMTAAQIKFFADALGRYPADIARKVVADWIETKVFFPALAELHEGCKRELKGRDQIEGAIRRRLLPEEPVEKPESLPVTADFIRAMKEKYGFPQAAAIRAKYGRNG